MRLVLDIETDSVEPDQVSKLWCVVLKDIDNGEVTTYTEENMGRLPSHLALANYIIGHNIICYDYLVIERFYPGCIAQHKIIDTLVLSRLLKAKPNDGNGHGLEAWGARLETSKLPSPSDFSVMSDELVAYCKQDVEITAKLYEYLTQWLDLDSPSVQTEMQIAWVCLDIQLNGFKYDHQKALVLKSELEQRLRDLDAEILRAFPPRPIPIREITPKATKYGTISKANLPRDWTDLSKLSVGCPFTLIRWEEFNPNSSKQVVDRLNAGMWKPTVFTDKGTPRICEENLATVPRTAPEGARKLVERMLVASRVRTLDQWAECYEVKDGRIHGRFNPIGTWTGRMAHRSPNMGNIAAEKSIKYKTPYLNKLATTLGGDMRSLWICDDGNWLVGCDAEGIQLRIFAHYINDPAFTKALIEGKKEDGSDPHSINATILRCSRDSAKTFIYAFLLGAGSGKLAEILNCGRHEGERRKENFIEAYPGLQRLREDTIPADAKRGFFVGFDNRKVYCNDEHLMLAGYLQNGEAVIMKHANLLWRKQLNEEQIDYRQVNFVHDEWQTECRGGRGLAEYVGRVQAKSIQTTGEALGLNCPMAGQFQIAKNWRDTH